MTSGGKNFNNFPENQPTKQAMATIGIMYPARGGLWQNLCTGLLYFVVRVRCPC